VYHPYTAWFQPATCVWCVETDSLVSRHIKASSPRLNILIIAGFLLVPPSAVLRGLIFSREYYGISVSVATVLCQVSYSSVRLYGSGRHSYSWFSLQVELHVTNTALTVAVATLFAKNWRIYRIFHNQRMQILVSFPYESQAVCTHPPLSSFLDRAGYSRITVFC